MESIFSPAGRKLLKEGGMARSSSRVEVEITASPVNPALMSMRKRGIVSGSPMTPVAREALRDIVSSPSPSVKMLVSKHRQLENELEERARLEKEREAKRAEMIREASLLRAIRRRRAEQARYALNLAEKELANAEPATPIEVRDSMAAHIVLLRKELENANEEHKNACLIEKECISDAYGSPDKLNSSVQEFMRAPSPSSTSDVDCSLSKRLEDELYQGGDECTHKAISMIESGDVSGAKTQLREAREHFLDVGDDVLMAKLSEIQDAERKVEQLERQQLKERREAGEEALRGVELCVEQSQFTDAWKLLGQAESLLGNSEDGDGDQNKQILVDWENMIRNAEEEDRKKTEAARESEREMDRKKEEAARERRRHRDMGNETLEMAMQALKKDDFTLAKTLITEAGVSFDKADIDMREGIAAFQHRAILGEKLHLQKQEKESREKEEIEREKDKEEKERRRLAEEESQRKKNSELGENAFKGSAVACDVEKDFARARRLLGLAETAFNRAGLDRKADLDIVMANIREGENEVARLELEAERKHQMALRGEKILRASRALAGEGDFVRAIALLQEAAQMFDDAEVDKHLDLEHVSIIIQEGRKAKEMEIEEEKLKSQMEEISRREREEIERVKALEEKRRAYSKVAEETLMKAATAFTRDWDFHSARRLLKEAERDFFRAGRYQEVQDDLVKMIKSIEDAEIFVDLQVQAKEQEARQVEEDRQRAENEIRIRRETERARGLLRDVLSLLQENSDFEIARISVENARRDAQSSGLGMDSEISHVLHFISEKQKEHMKAQQGESRRAEMVSQGDAALRQSLATLGKQGPVDEARAALQQALRCYQVSNVLAKRQHQIDSISSMIAEAFQRERACDDEVEAILGLETGIQCLENGDLEEALMHGEKAKQKLAKSSKENFGRADGLVGAIKSELERRREEDHQMSEADKAVEEAIRALDSKGDVQHAKELLAAAVRRYDSGPKDRAEIRHVRINQVRSQIAVIEEDQRRKRVEEEKQAAAREAARVAAVQAEAAVRDAVDLTEKGKFVDARERLGWVRSQAHQSPDTRMDEIVNLESWISGMEAIKIAADEEKRLQDENKRMEEEKQWEELKRLEDMRRQVEERLKIQEEALKVQRQRIIEEKQAQVELDAKIAQEAAEALRAEKEVAVRREETERIDVAQKVEAERMAAAEREAEEVRMVKWAQKSKIAEEKKAWEAQMAPEIARANHERIEREKVLAEAAKELEERKAMRRELEKRKQELFEQDERAAVMDRLRESERMHKIQSVDATVTEAKLALEEGDYARARQALHKASSMTTGAPGTEAIVLEIQGLNRDIDSYQLEEAQQIDKLLALPTDHVNRLHNPKSPESRRDPLHSALVTSSTPLAGFRDTSLSQPDGGNASSDVTSRPTVRWSALSSPAKSHSNMEVLVSPFEQDFGSAGQGLMISSFASASSIGNSAERQVMPIHISSGQQRHSLNNCQVYPWTLGPEDETFELLDEGLTVGANTTLPFLAKKTVTTPWSK